MGDYLTKEQRSINMAAIKSRRTKPELFIRHELHLRGYRYRVNVNYIPGHPDLFLRKYNLAIYVNGCFWHRHQNCKYSYMPKSNWNFWNTKFNANIQRDEKVKRDLQLQGIRQMIIWECFIDKMKKNDQLKVQGLAKVENFISSTETFVEFE